MIKIKLKVKFITKDIELRPHESINNFSDKILLENTLYEKLFGKKYKDFHNKPWKRGIVKVSTGERSVHLLFCSGNSKGISANECGIGPESKHILFENYNSEKQKVEISKGHKFWFYWNHPTHYQRVAFKLCMWGLLITIINLIHLLTEIIK